MNRIRKRQLVERITEAAMWESARYPSGRRRPILRDSDLPGRRITQLSEEERKVLKECTAKDFSWRGFK